MKCILSGLLTGYLLLTATRFLKAQENTIAFNNKDLSRSTSAQSLVGNLVKLSEKQVNIRAVRDYVNRFKKTDSATWYKVRDGYIVNHPQNGDQMRTGYAFNGNWLYDMASYSEDKMPNNVWRLVKAHSMTFLSPG